MIAPKQAFNPPCTERPILFSGSMVRAILSGSKTMTRRVIKPQPSSKLAEEFTTEDVNAAWQSGFVDVKCPYGDVGDRLWVREKTHKRPQPHLPLYGLYSADGAWAHNGWQYYRWVRPSIHMPHKYSRITLEITDIRVERLWDITEQDAKAEGVRADNCGSSYKWQFTHLWERINGKKHPWSSNPWSCSAISITRKP